MKRGLTILFIAGLLGSGCSTAGTSSPEPQAESTSDKCDDVTSRGEEWEEEIATWREQLDSIQTEEFLTLEEQAWERENPDKILFQAIATLQLIVDNPDCYSPGDVAKAKTALEKYDDVL